MDDVARHPDDEQLFDLVDGALDDARARAVRQHLDRCAACAAFVEAASVGGEAAAGLVEPMPADAVEALDVAVRAAWRERVDAIAARERSEDATAAATAPTDPVEVDHPRVAAEPDAALPAGPRRARRRRFVPILAFVVLALLAGVSIQLGDRGTSSTAPSSEDTAPESIASTTQGGADGSDVAGAGAAAGAVADTAERNAGKTTDPALSTPPVDEAAQGAEPASEPVVERECIATRDSTQLRFPDGRPVQQVHYAPLGIYVICG